MQRKFLIASMMLGLTTTTAASNNWMKLLEQSDRSRLKAEQARMPALPVVAPVSSDFGLRIHPITGNDRHHKGIDLAADEGEIFNAVSEGRVIQSTQSKSFGKTLLIEHTNGITTRYAHASELLVKNGDWVTKNQAIGRVGQSGLATGPHLHFEVHMDGNPIDPDAFLTRTSDKSSVIAQKREVVKMPIVVEEEEAINIVETQKTRVNTIDIPVGLNENHINQIALSEPEPEPRFKNDGRYLKTNRSLWAISNELSRSLDYPSINEIMNFIVETNPDSFPTGDKNYRLAHVPMYIPNDEVLVALLPQYMRTNQPIWIIAEKLKAKYSSDATIYQIMLALKNNNSSAFVNNNINYRLASIPLKLPSPDQYKVADQRTALSSFKNDIKLSNLGIKAT